MKRASLIAIAIVLALLSLTAVTLSAIALASGGGTSTDRPRLITVNGTAVAQAKPDEAVVDVGASAESSDPQQAQTQSATKMSAVLQALESAGILKEDMKTTGVSLDQRVEHRGTKHETTVYVAHNTVEVTIRDLSAIGSDIDAAVAAGANTVNDLQFKVSNPSAARREALSAAVRNARTKAAALASAAGASVVRVVSIREESPVQPFAQREAFPAALSATTPVVPPDEIQSQVTVSVVWALA